MAKKRDSRSSSTCERILNAIRPSRVFRPISPGSTRKPPKPLSTPPPPRTSGNPGMAVAGNGKEKGVPVQNGNDDQVAMVMPAKIAPATESERTKPKGILVVWQPGLEPPEASKKMELKPSGATSNNAEEKPNPQVQVQEGTNSKGSAGDHIENRFTDYIERARAKLRTVSSIGSGGKKEKMDTTGETDEHFTNFITKAKAKLRTTSSIGGRKGFTSYK